MKKLSASSLLEILVAGVLLCVIVTISLLTFVNVLAVAPSFRNHQLDVMLQLRIKNIQSERVSVRNVTDTLEGGGYMVETITNFTNKKNLFLIDLEVRAADGTVKTRACALHYQNDGTVN